MSLHLAWARTHTILLNCEFLYFVWLSSHSFKDINFKKSKSIISKRMLQTIIYSLLLYTGTVCPLGTHVFRFVMQEQCPLAHLFPSRKERWWCQAALCQFTKRQFPENRCAEWLIYKLRINKIYLILTTIYNVYSNSLQLLEISVMMFWSIFILYA